MLIILLGNDLRCHRICPRVLGMVKNCISGFLKRGAVGCGEVRGGAQFISTPKKGLFNAKKLVFYIEKIYLI